MATSRPTRFCENPEVDYPPFYPGQWGRSGHLPISSEIIGAIRFTVSNSVSGKDASLKIAQILIDHWTKRNVYTKTFHRVWPYKENLPERKTKQSQFREIHQVYGGEGQCAGYFYR